MPIPQINFESRTSLLSSLDRIARKFAGDLYLDINGAAYRVVDFEFYVYAPGIFEDPHTYCHDLQQEWGRLYLHGSGLDITFGDGTNHVGMLLRSVIRLYDGAGQETGFMKQQYEGPQVVATELLSHLAPLTSGGTNTIRLVDVNGHNMDATFYPAKHLVKTKRIGLTPKSSDREDFFKNLHLRFVACVPYFRQKIRGVEAVLEDGVKAGTLTTEEAHKILGYQKQFQQS